MAESLAQARFNLAQADKFPTWFDHLSKVESVMAAQDAWINKWYALGWEIDEFDGTTGWVAPDNWDPALGNPTDDEPNY